MMMSAEQRYCRGRSAPGLPGHDVMDIGEGHVVQPGKRHSRSRRLTSRRWACWEALGPSLVHGVPDVVVDPDGDGGVTGDPLDRLGIDQAVTLELTGERRGSAASSTSAARDMDDDEVRAAACRTPRGADDLQEGVAAALVPGRLAFGGDLLGPGLEQPWSRRRTPPGAGPNGPVLVVEAQVAAICCSAPGPRTGRGAVRGDIGQLSDRALPGLVAQLTVGLGRGDVGDGPHLVEGDLALAECTRQMREISGLLGDVRRPERS